MNRIHALALAAAALGCAFTVPAFAQSWYAEVGAGSGKAKGEDVTSDRKTTWAARTGARLSPNFAVDLGYYDLGKYDVRPLLGQTGKAKASSVGVSLVAIAPIHAFDVYGRVGYARSESKLDLDVAGGGSVSAKKHDNEAFYGVGGRYNFGDLAVFVEWNKHDKLDLDYYMAGLQWGF